MEIILKEDIRKLGKAGEVVRVKPGYARNFLLPRGLAIAADPKNLRMLEHQKRVIQAAQVKKLKQAQELAARLKALTVTITREAGPEEKLFGSVTNADIATALRHEGLSIEKRQIELEEPIKQIGEHDITVKLNPEVTTTVKVCVVKA